MRDLRDKRNDLIIIVRYHLSGDCGIHVLVAHRDTWDGGRNGFDLMTYRVLFNCLSWSLLIFYLLPASTLDHAAGSSNVGFAPAINAENYPAVIIHCLYKLFPNCPFSKPIVK